MDPDINYNSTMIANETACADGFLSKLLGALLYEEPCGMHHLFASLHLLYTGNITLLRCTSMALQREKVCDERVTAPSG
jgi:hypothetical protein